MNNTDVISVLNNLVRTCVTGQECFRKAAEGAHNSEFRRLFNIFSQQRAQFVTELQGEVHRLGGDGSSNAASESTSKNKSNVISMIPRDESALMADCQREEEAAVNEYEEALRSDLPLDVQYVVKRQYMDIRDAYDRIRILQRAA